MLVYQRVRSTYPLVTWEGSFPSHPTGTSRLLLWRHRSWGYNVWGSQQRISRTWRFLGLGVQLFDLGLGVAKNIDLYPHDGSMVLLCMVCHGSHQYTPVMLAYIPAPWIRHGYRLFSLTCCKLRANPKLGSLFVYTNIQVKRAICTVSTECFVPMILASAGWSPPGNPRGPRNLRFSHVSSRNLRARQGLGSVIGRYSAGSKGSQGIPRDSC